MKKAVFDRSGRLLLAAVARAAVEGVVAALALGLVPLHRLEEVLARLDQRGRTGRPVFASWKAIRAIEVE